MSAMQQWQELASFAEQLQQRIDDRTTQAEAAAEGGQMGFVLLMLVMLVMAWYALAVWWWRSLGVSVYVCLSGLWWQRCLRV